MEININNYEIYVIDFIDAKLNEIDSANLLIFLNQNPVLKAEFESLINASKLIPEENTSFDGSYLIKPENIIVNNYTEKLIALIENDLPESEKEVLLREINRYPELKKACDLFFKTKLIPDSKIFFEDKESLIKKPLRIIPSFFKISAIAALFIAAVIVFYFVNNFNYKNQLAENTTIFKAKQDSISRILKSKTNIPIVLQRDNEKQRFAYGSVNAALIIKNGKKQIFSPVIRINKNVKNLIKENQINIESHVSEPLPLKIISNIDNVICKTTQIELPKLDEKQVLKENYVVNYLANNNNIDAQNIETSKNEYKNRSLTNYLKQQLQMIAQSEVIVVNKPTNLTESITLAETIGLNVLSVFNLVSNQDLKVQKTYNNDGEIEKVRLVATGL